MAEDRDQNPIEETADLVKGLAGITLHLVGYKTLRGFVETIRETSYARRFLNIVHPMEGPERERYGTRYISDIYAELHKQHPSYVISLTAGEKAAIDRIANTEISALNEFENQFIDRVMERVNRVYYDTYRDNRPRLIQGFKQLIEIDYNHSRATRYILSEEIKNMERSRERDLRVVTNKPGALTLGDTVTIKGSSRWLTKRGISEELYGYDTKDLNKLEKQFRKLSIPTPSEQNIVPRAPLINIGDPTMIVDPSERFVPLGEIHSRIRQPDPMKGVKHLISELKAKGADPNATIFFNELSNLMKSGLEEGGLQNYRIKYSLISGADGMLEVEVAVDLHLPQESERTTYRQRKWPIRFKVPVSRAGAVNINGTAWRLLGSRDISAVLPELASSKQGDYYTTVLANFRKQFGSIMFGQYSQGDFAGAQRRITEMIDKPLLVHREALNPQPILQARSVEIDLQSRIAAGKFDEGLAPKRIVLGRIQSMQKLRRLIMDSKGSFNLPEKYLVVDFEVFPSTMKGAGKPIIHQVTMSLVENGEIVDMIARDINPHSAQYTKNDFHYTYPEKDLTLTYKGWSREAVMNRLAKADNFDQVQNEIVEWVQGKTGGQRIPIMAYGANFEKEMIRQNFRKFYSLYSEWIDPMEFHRALNPAIRESHSQANVGLRMKILERDPISQIPRISTEMLLAMKQKPQVLKALEKSGDREVIKMVRAIRSGSVDQIKELALHTATADVIVTQEIAKQTAKLVNRRSAEILDNLNKNLFTLGHSFRGSANPIVTAMMAMQGPGDYRSVSTMGLMAGKFSNFDLTDLGPMQELGVDPTRPLLQMYAGARLLTGRRPVITTKAYDEIADRYGEVFTDILVGSIKSPLTAADASLIDIKALSKMSAHGYQYKIHIPNNKELRIHQTIKDVMEELENSPPEQHQGIINKSRGKIAKAFSGQSGTYGDLIPPESMLAEFRRDRYTTHKKLYSVLENITFNEQTNEYIFKFGTVDQLGYHSAPVKLLGGVKSVASITRGLDGIDMIANLNLEKRGRADAAMLYVNTVAKNLQMLYEHERARTSPELAALIREFTETVNKTLDIDIHPIAGEDLRFRYDRSAKDLPYLERQRLIGNAERFVRGDWTTFVTRFSRKIMQVKDKLGIRTPHGSPIEMFWTERSIEQTLRREYYIANRGSKKKSWSHLSRKEKEAFRVQMEQELLTALETNPLGSGMDDQQRRLVTRLTVGSPRLIQPYGGQVMSLFWTRQARAFEHSENFNKGTMVNIPALDAIVVEGDLAKNILRTRTAAQRDMLAFYQAAYPTFQYGQLPGKSDFPTLNATQIKLPEISKDAAELQKILSAHRGASVFIPETGDIYDERTGRGLPTHLIDTKTGELKPGYTKQPISPGLLMHTETMSALFGYTPRFVEFEMGKYRATVPIPGIQQVSAAAAPPRLIPGSTVYSIVQKEHQSIYHLKLIHDAYRKAEQEGNEEAMERAIKGFDQKLDSYRSLMLSNKSVFMDMLNPKIPGVEGKLSAVYYPGTEPLIGKGAGKLVSGFDVMKISIKEMGDKYLDMALESHKLPDGTYIGGSGSGKKYASKSAFKRAVLDEGELLLGALIRRPAENALAWDERLVAIDKHNKLGIAGHYDDMMMRHFDFDGDVGAWIINTRSPEEIERKIKDYNLERLRARRADREIAQRVIKFQTTVMEFSAMQDSGAKKQSALNKILNELNELRSITDRKLQITAEGIFVRVPTKESATMAGRKKIRQGFGDIFELQKMNLSQFARKDKMGIPLPDDAALLLDSVNAFDTTARQSYEGFLAQLVTKASAGYVYAPGHFTRLAIQGMGDRQTQSVKGVLDEFYGMITQMKKFPGRESEHIVRAMMHPDLPSSAHTIASVMSDKFLSEGIDPFEGAKNIQKAVRKLRATMGSELTRTSIRMAIRSVPLTPEMNTLFFERVQSMGELAMEKELFFGKPSLTSRFRSGNAKIGGFGVPIAIAISGMVFSRDRDVLNNKQEYIVPRGMNLTSTTFPARTHIMRYDKPRTKRVNTQNFDPPPGFYTSSYPLATDRIVDLTNRF